LSPLSRPAASAVDVKIYAAVFPHMFFLKTCLYVPASLFWMPLLLHLGFSERVDLLSASHMMEKHPSFSSSLCPCAVAVETRGLLFFNREFYATDVFFCTPFLPKTLSFRPKGPQTAAEPPSLFYFVNGSVPTVAPPKPGCAIWNFFPRHQDGRHKRPWRLSRSVFVDVKATQV